VSDPGIVHATLIAPHDSANGPEPNNAVAAYLSAFGRRPDVVASRPGRQAIVELRSTMSRRTGSALHDPVIQLLIDGLDRAVDLGVGRAKLMRDQLYKQIDALDERRSGGHRAGRR
jgi:hypothetical protein